MVAIGVVSAGVSIGWLLRAVPAISGPPTQEEECLVRAIVGRSPDTTAHLALLGDKRFLFDDARSAFVMYGVQGTTWIAMGAPVGPAEAHGELLWRFIDLARDHSGRPAFYEVAGDALETFVDLGLTPIKLGEEARVPLADFSLQGRPRKDLRQALRRCEREGGRFEVLPPADVPAAIEELRAVSDAWLAAKRGGEKQFSLGRFDPDYLSSGSMAVVRVEGRIVAFANLWEGAEHDELSVDLMRYTPAAPHGVMDALFAALMEWGHDQGYRWFNLGMSPLAGLGDRPGAPCLQRLGHLAYRYGEAFYSFEGLRAYKCKFHPVWRGRYLVVTSRWALPRVLRDVIALTSGGVVGAIGRGRRDPT